MGGGGAAADNRGLREVSLGEERLGVALNTDLYAVFRKARG